MHSKAIKDYNSGLSIKKTSELNGIPQTTLRRHLKKNKVKIRKYTTKATCVTELENLQIENWFVVKPILEKERKYTRVLWLCRCVCGNECKIRQTWLLQGKVKKCRCCSVLRAGNCNWNGCGELSGTCWKCIQSHAKRKSRTLPFTITISYVWELYQKQKGKCALTGLDIPFPRKVKDCSFPSLDRIDSNKGYIEENVQWVHKDVNLMKWNLDQNYFKEMCKLIAQHGG